MDSGDFKSIQEAINASKAFPYQRVIIHVKNGVYNEKVTRIFLEYKHFINWRK